MIKKHCLDNTQMNKLIIKGFDTSDAWFECDDYVSYTFDDIANKLPVNISLLEDELSYQLNMWFDEDEKGKFFYVAYLPNDGTEDDIELHYEASEAPVDAVYQMLLWLNDNGFIK